MRERQREIDAAGAAVLLVTFEAAWIAKAYVAETGWPWPLLLDPERSLYHGYGMFSGRWTLLAGLRTTWLYLKLLISRRHRFHLPTADVRQLGGDVLVDAEGIVRVHHPAAGPAERIEVAALLEALRALKTA